MGSMVPLNSAWVHRVQASNENKLERIYSPVECEVVKREVVNRGGSVNIKFRTDAKVRNSQYEVTLEKDDIVALVTEIARSIPDMTETFAECLSLSFASAVSSRSGHRMEEPFKECLSGIVKTNIERLQTLVEEVKKLRVPNPSLGKASR